MRGQFHVFLCGMLCTGACVLLFQLQLVFWQGIHVQKGKFLIPFDRISSRCRHFPTIYVITPTYRRSTQKADLTRLSHTLRLVPALHWIVVEDNDRKSTLVWKLLNKSYVPYTHLNAQQEVRVHKLTEHKTRYFRGVSPRNEGLRWVREYLTNTEGHKEAVVFFGDDDNTYSLKVFEEMRFTQKVSIWPVAFRWNLRYEGPICKNGKVVSWRTLDSRVQRKFKVDMAGFAVNARLFLKYPHANFRDPPLNNNILESDLLEQLNITMNDLEPRADNCTKVYVWHTRTERPIVSAEKMWMKKHNDNSSLFVEV